MRVGLLEDDTAIQEMLLLVLEDEGYEVITFQNAQACLDALGVTQQTSSSVPVDIMIIDWRLNDAITGTEVIQRIRKQPHLQTLPIILTTAATFSNTEELRTLQIVLLEKPFAVDDITTLIKQLTQPQH
jgi:two-component system, chemotaxis family, chemotaxis protein CheY